MYRLRHLRDHNKQNHEALDERLLKVASVLVPGNRIKPQQMFLPRGQAGEDFGRAAAGGVVLLFAEGAGEIAEEAAAVPARGVGAAAVPEEGVVDQSRAGPRGH